MLKRISKCLASKLNRSSFAEKIDDANIEEIKFWGFYHTAFWSFLKDRKKVTDQRIFQNFKIISYRTGVDPTLAGDIREIDLFTIAEGRCLEKFLKCLEITRQGFSKNF